MTALSDSNGQIVQKYSYNEYGKMEVNKVLPPLNVRGGPHERRPEGGASEWGAQGELSQGHGLPRRTIPQNAVTSPPPTSDQQPATSDNLPDNPFTYTGQYFDKETGLYYYKNRYYSADQGRFISKDPLNMINGPNVYAYVNNNPMNWVDPMGTWSTKAHNKIIDESFGNKLSKEDIKILKDSSLQVDQDQTAEGSHKHSMLQRNQSLDEYYKKRSEFIDSKLDEAAQFEVAGQHQQAMKVFGEPAHTMMDSTSPVHTTADGKPKVWDPTHHPVDASQHSPTDWWGKEGTDNVTDPILEKNKKELGNLYSDFEKRVQSKKCEKPSSESQPIDSQETNSLLPDLQPMLEGSF